MKITVLSSSLYPSSEECYGSEHMAMHLADELGKDHDVIFFAAPKTPGGNYELLNIPPSHGNAGFRAMQCEIFPLKNHREILTESDYIIDQSATHKTIEDLWWYSRDELSETIVVWCRNGTTVEFPRNPIRSQVPGVCLSEAAKEKILEDWEIPPEVLSVVPYGIDTELYKPDGYGGDYICYTGAPREEKGIYKILEIARRLPEEKFVLGWHAYNDMHRKTEKEFLKELEVRDLDNVEFQPWAEDSLDEKLELFRGAKAFLQPTHEGYIEAFGLTSAEAMACGTPVIRENRGSAPELVLSGVHSFLCETVDEYVEAIKNIDSIDPKDCRHHVVESYSKEKYAEEYLKLYEELS